MKLDKEKLYVEHNDIVAFHPAYYLIEIMEEKRYTLYEFARELDIRKKHLEEIMLGKRSLSFDDIEKISTNLNTSNVYWINLQLGYYKLLGEFENEVHE